MSDEIFGGGGFFRVPERAHRGFPLLLGESLVTVQELLHLDDVIGERFGGRIDGRQTSANDHDRHAQLQVRERVGLGGAGQLERHQKIGSLADAADQAVLHGDHGGTASPGAQCDVVEAHGKGVVDGDRAAETHAAKHAEFGAALEQETDDLQKIFVPANGYAIFRHAAKAGHHAVVQRFVQLIHVANRTEGNAFAEGRDAGNILGQRLNLQAIDGGDRVAVVHQVVRQRETGGA